MCQIKALIAGKTQSNRYAHGASFSTAIAKIGNAELAHFTKQMLTHELIRGSLVKNWKDIGWPVFYFGLLPALDDQLERHRFANQLDSTR